MQPNKLNSTKNRILSLLRSLKVEDMEAVKEDVIRVVELRKRIFKQDMSKSEDSTSVIKEEVKVEVPIEEVKEVKVMSEAFEKAKKIMASIEVGEEKVKEKAWGTAATVLRADWQALSKLAGPERKRISNEAKKAIAAKKAGK
jgi:hypothetical protein